MTEYKKLYNQIDKLNNKIKKLEMTINNKKHLNNSDHISKSSLISYRIHFPNESYSNKKYIGLKFDNNLNECDTDENKSIKNLISFIKLFKSNVIINYTIQLELNYTPLQSILCSIAIGIKSSNITDSKIRIVKGTKYIFDLSSSNVIDNKLIISNSVLYSSEENDELCIIADFDFNSGLNCIVNNKKSIIKILYV